MLVHICCSVDSHYFMSELKKLYPDEKIVGFFYNPNIHPLSEHELRYLDVKRSCKKLGIRLIKGRYDYQKWFNLAKDYANEPEKGERCDLCFDVRMQKSVDLAVRLKEKSFTSTLFMSPKKDIEQLSKSVKKECEARQIDFLIPDFRKGGGTQKQFELARKENLYHQNYCGCFFALDKQNINKSITNEFLSPINRQILPASISERIKTFKKLGKLEEENKPFKLVRDKFLNYRLLYALLKCDNALVKSHILFYSHFKNKKTRFSIQSPCESFFAHKDEVNVWSFEYFNKLCKNKFKNFDNLLKKPPTVDYEIALRQKHFGAYNLSPIIIVEKIPQGKFDLLARSEIYFDTRDRIVSL